MIEFLGRHKRIFLLSGIALCILAIILTINPSAGTNVVERGVANIITPMQRGANVVISWVQGNFSALSNNQQLLQDMRSLQEQVNAFQLEIDRLHFAGEENARLSAMLGMSQRYEELPTVGARVIGTVPNDWNRRYFIGLGANDGIKNNMAVIGDGGLLGVTRRVHSGRATVVTVVDSEFSVAVMSTRTGDIGMARGDIRLMQQGLMRMERIDATAQIMPGDEIRTSTHSSIFPPGILVGTVVDIHSNPDGHTRYAIIRPAVNLDNIEMVLVVTTVFGDELATQDGHTFVLED